MQISKTIRNEVVEAIHQSAFEPFEFDKDEDERGLSVHHRPSGSKMMVQRGAQPGHFFIRWTVGTEPIRNRHLQGLGNGTGLWLKELKTDLDTPDLWAELGQEPQMSGLLEDQENTPFTQQELQEISRVLAEVKRQAQDSYELPAEQLLALEAKLDYLCEAASRTGRVDWLNLAVGAIVGRAADVLLAPEVMHRVLHALGTGLGPLFGHPAPLVGP